MNNPNETGSSTARTTRAVPGSGERTLVRLVSLETPASRAERAVLFCVRRIRSVIPLFVVMAADLAALVAAGETAVWLRHVIEPAQYAAGFPPFMLIYAALVMFGYAATGLYSVVALSSPDELRRLTLATTALTIIMLIATYASRARLDIGEFMYLIAWGFALVAVPLARSASRALFAGRRWWGRKAIILARDLSEAERIVDALNRQPRLGLRPVTILTTGGATEGAPPAGLPHLHGIDSAVAHARELEIDYAIVALSDLNDPEGLRLIRRYEMFFKHWLVVPYFAQGYSLWVRSRDLEGMLALEITHRLLRGTDQIAKRVTDVLLTLLLAVPAVPLGILLAVAVKLDSRGPVLYRHDRLGRNGKPIRILKFRSMHAGAAARLERHLEQHPQLRAEWNQRHKLSNDPRVTRIGRLLRKTSLDELPQLFNVLCGHMSLVGPRPIVSEEISRYGDSFEIYKRVRPGLTGLWQVMGRSNLGYDERVELDVYYVRNWSLWLDIYLLARTVTAVFAKDGAF